MARMTVRQMAEQVRSLLQAGRPTRDLHFDEREIMGRVRDTASSLMNARWYQGRNDGESKAVYSGWVMKFEGVTIQEDSNGNNYAELPAEPDDLPDDTAIQGIWPEGDNIKEDLEVFIPIPHNARAVLYRLPAYALEQRFGYYPEAEKVVFTKRRGQTLIDEKINTVSMEIVTTNPKEVSDDDVLPISPHLRNQLLLSVLQTFGVSAAMGTDLVNDNNLEENANSSRNTVNSVSNPSRGSN